MITPKKVNYGEKKTSKNALLKKLLLKTLPLQEL